MKKEDEFFYVCVPDSINLRKDILLSSKAILDTLKSFEMHTAMKAEKMKLYNELKKNFDEILSLDRKLKNLLPKVKSQTVNIELKETPKKTLNTRTQTKPIVKSKLDLLEEELSRVESKLSSLR